MDLKTVIDQDNQADSVFSGISTFGRLPYFPCLASDEEKYDIAFIGRTKRKVKDKPITDIVTRSTV